MEEKPSVIVDTGFIYALYCKNDFNHQKAKEAARVYGNLCWLTSCFVFQEIFWLLGEDNPLQVFEAERAGIFQVVSFDRKQFLSIEKIVKKYSDRYIDLADASLIFLAEQLGQGDILTTDLNDFKIYRWNRTNSFNLLL